MKQLLKEIIEHLNKDSNAWLKLSNEAREEAYSDLMLLRKINEETEKLKAVA